MRAAEHVRQLVMNLGPSQVEQPDAEPGPA
jgi:hypothetical protein